MMSYMMSDEQIAWFAAAGVELSSTAHSSWALRITDPFADDPKWEHLWGLEMNGLDPEGPTIGLSFSWLSVTTDLVARALWLCGYSDFDINRPEMVPRAFQLSPHVAIDLVHSLRRDWGIRK